MKKNYFLKIFCLVYLGLLISINAIAQPIGANINNPIYAGTLSPGITYSDTKNNSPSNGYLNDIGQSSDDIYYRFTIANPSDVQISHCSSAFDTYMYLLDVNGNVIYSNDDSGPLCATLQASLGVSLSAGTYYVVSEGYSSNYGDITTSISVPAVQTFEEEADYALANLDMSPVTSGILYDKTFPAANLEAYQGTANDPSTNSDHFHQAYSEMYSSKFNKAGLVTPEAFNDYLSANYDKTNHTIGVLLYTYHYLDTNAVKNNLLYISNGQLYDVPNRPAAPYIATTSIIATPLFPAETILEAGDHSFTFDPGTILTNTSLGIASITIDFDDGYGSQVLYDGSAGFKGQAQTSGFLQRVAHWFGKKSFLVRLIVVWSNGTTYQSKSKVEVIDPGPKTIIAGCNGGDAIQITGAAFDGSAYGKGVESAGGKASIFYNNANCGTGIITKPIIFLDGFDPTNDRDVQKIYDEYINTQVRMNGQLVLLGDKLRADGYDIVVFDYNDGSDLIEKTVWPLWNLPRNCTEDMAVICNRIL